MSGVVDFHYANMVARKIEQVQPARVLHETPIGGNRQFQYLQQIARLTLSCPTMTMVSLGCRSQNKAQGVGAAREHVLQGIAAGKPHQLRGLEPGGVKRRGGALDLFGACVPASRRSRYRAGNRAFARAPRSPGRSLPRWRRRAAAGRYRLRRAAIRRESACRAQLPRRVLSPSA